MASTQSSTRIPGRSDGFRGRNPVGKGKQSLVNGARLRGRQKSDYLIVAKKTVKAVGAKGVTNLAYS